MFKLSMALVVWITRLMSGGKTKNGVTFPQGPYKTWRAYQLDALQKAKDAMLKQTAASPSSNAKKTASADGRRLYRLHQHQQGVSGCRVLQRIRRYGAEGRHGLLAFCVQQAVGCRIDIRM
ncbi:hypothetical protein [Achromobacter dolens]|uniref:hypothetical protein n=1 Tax=Achromobacter dolens TaxID=1287738 RepID=UPI00300CE3F6